MQFPQMHGTQCQTHHSSLPDALLRSARVQAGPAIPKLRLNRRVKCLVDNSHSNRMAQKLRPPYIEER